MIALFSERLQEDYKDNNDSHNDKDNNAPVDDVADNNNDDSGRANSTK